MANIDKTGEKGDKSRYFSTLTDNEVRVENIGIDLSSERLKRDKKDKDIREYYDFYKKKPLYDRHHKSAKFAHWFGFFLSSISAYLSYPYLFFSLENDMPHLYLRWGFVLLVVVVNELIKHSTIVGAARSWLTYSRTPLLTGSLFIGSVIASVFMCYNGIETTNDSNYESNKPKKENFVSDYQSSINELKTANERLFSTSNWRGRLGGEAQKTYSKREAEITRLSALAIEDIDQKYDDAISKYNASFGRHSSLRKYLGFFVEGSIVFCCLYWLWFMYVTQKEQSLIRIYSIPNDNQLEPKNLLDSLKPDPVQVLGFQARKKATGSADKLSDKDFIDRDYLLAKDVQTLLRNAKRDKKSYEGKLRKGIGREQNNKNKIEHYSNEINRLTVILNSIKKDD